MKFNNAALLLLAGAQALKIMDAAGKSSGASAAGSFAAVPDDGNLEIDKEAKAYYAANDEFLCYAGKWDNENPGVRFKGKLSTLDEHPCKWGGCWNSLLCEKTETEKVDGVEAKVDVGLYSNGKLLKTYYYKTDKKNLTGEKYKGYTFTKSVSFYENGDL